VESAAPCQLKADLEEKRTLAPQQPQKDFVWDLVSQGKNEAGQN
jgi:hypothetical protein